MGNQGKFTKKQSRKTNVFSKYSRSDFTSGDETYTAGGETYGGPYLQTQQTILETQHNIF